MPNTILLKRSDVSNSVPSVGNLLPGELAINYADGNLFFKDAANNIVLLTSTQTVSVTGNISGSNVNASGQVVAVGNVTGNYFIGNGSQLTGIQAGSITTFSSTPPVTPAQGDIWIDADSGIQYIYFNDGSSNQWAEMEAQTSFASVSGGTGSPGGSNTQIQFNDNSSFGGSSDFTFNKTSNTVGVVNIIASGTVELGNVSNVKITGGSSGQVLRTDGTGNLSWTTQSGGGSSFSEVTTSPYQAVTGDKLFVNCANASMTITLPLSPLLGDEVTIVDATGTSATNNIIVDRNSSNIVGVAQNLTIDINGAAVTLAYYNIARGWVIVSSS